MGHTCKDKVSGFVGVCTGVVDYLTGCSQALLSPKADEKNSVGESKWFDLQRLVIVEGSIAIVLDNSATPGCDLAAPVR